ncbi:hypothetical protein BCR34DRAFT_282907 [Clohesyomyces aquaticus]|uniref:Uncharacterized protein n=1 Tax=Clohesyomyces aquaticus TaxID=1231657 RepID=A0A1Y1ZRV7_9PLEO|nr:hypothetical protein BCR34DRAFT_282907 [Clohesyomyces aquaticus]
MDIGVYGKVLHTQLHCTYGSALGSLFVPFSTTLPSITYVAIGRQHQALHSPTACGLFWRTVVIESESKTNLNDTPCVSESLLTAKMTDEGADADRRLKSDVYAHFRDSKAPRSSDALTRACVSSALTSLLLRFLRECTCTCTLLSWLITHSSVPADQHLDHRSARRRTQTTLPE